MLGPQNGQLGLAHIAIRLASKQAVDDLTKRFALDGFRVLSGPRTTGDGYYETLIEGYESLKSEITE